MVSKLSKSYGKAVALDNLSLEVKKGEKFCLLGENGAGKSTLLAILAGLIKDFSGSAEVLGIDARQFAAGRLGVFVQNSAFPANKTVLEVLEFFCRLKGLDKSEAYDAVRRVGMENFKSKRVRELSHGMARLLGIAQALLGNPPMVILDEPTSGLDIEFAHRIKILVKSLHSTVLLSTHIADSASVCNRFAIIRHGRIVHTGKVGKNLEKAYLEKIRNTV